MHRIGQSSLVGYITNNHVGAASGANLCPAQITEQGDRSAIHVYVSLNLNETGGCIPAALPSQIGNVSVRVITTDDIKAQ